MDKYFNSIIYLTKYIYTMAFYLFIFPLLLDTLIKISSFRFFPLSLGYFVWWSGKHMSFGITQTQWRILTLSVISRDILKKLLNFS